MENKITIFRDSGGYVTLVDRVGSDLSLINNPQMSSDPKKDEVEEADHYKIERLIDRERDDVLAGCTAMFKIRAPLFVAREHTSLSGWNCNELNKYLAGPATKFYEPGAYRAQARHGFGEEVINPVLQDKVRLARFRVYRATRALSMHHEMSLQLYKNMIQAGICREQAMATLPQNVYVEYYASASLDNVLKFTNLVSDEKCLPELREIAQAVLNIVRGEFPVATQKWENSVRRKKADVAQRFNKLSQLIKLSEKLNQAQTESVMKIKKRFLDGEEKNKNENAEDNISKGQQGSGSPETPKSTRRKTRWSFWKKNRGSG
jgi:hypothetical protein